LLVLGPSTVTSGTLPLSSGPLAQTFSYATAWGHNPSFNSLAETSTNNTFTNHNQ